jgi:hypothetical protein
MMGGALRTGMQPARSTRQTVVIANEVRPMRLIAIATGLLSLAGAALAQTGPATSDKPSAAASPSATVKTEREREERAAGQGRPVAPGTDESVQPSAPAEDGTGRPPR